jgi:hypothetical protein
VYVDQSPAAAQFFAEERAVNEFVNRKKSYKQTAYVRFIHQDYSAPLPVMDGSFDLVLALFAGGISAACARYLKIGGILITNNHQDDAVDASRDNRLVFKASSVSTRGSIILKTKPGINEKSPPKNQAPGISNRPAMGWYTQKTRPTLYSSAFASPSIGEYLCRPEPHQSFPPF